MLRLYSKENNLKINDEIFPILEEFTFDYNNTFNQNIYLNQKLNILNILSNIINNESIKSNNQIENLKLTLYMLMKNSYKNKIKQNLDILKDILGVGFIEYKNNKKPLGVRDDNNVYE